MSTASIISQEESQATKEIIAEQERIDPRGERDARLLY